MLKFTQMRSLPFAERKNKMYKYETHCHTSEASGCGMSTGAEMAQKYKDEGYDGIFVTDHFFNGNSAVPRDLPWKDRIELYCKGYENAKAHGDKIGLDVFFGVEYTFYGADFLIYGADKQWLIENGNILDVNYEITDVLNYCRSCGFFVVQAHPFRDVDYIKRFTLCPHNVDAIEVINASHFNKEFNKRAKTYAEWYDLPETAGSDSHSTTERYFGGGILTETPIKSYLDYKNAVLSRKITLLEGNIK